MRQAEAFSEKALRVALQSTFGFPDFRGQQLEAVQAVLAGRDALVLMATGGGKSLCYALPAVVLGKLTVVVSPLIGLMQDQVGHFRARGVAAAFLASRESQTEAERDSVYRELWRGAPQLRLLYITPEGLEKGRSLLLTLQGLYAQGRLGLLAVDEAHCISEWGHDFRPAYRKLALLRFELPRLPVLALTATARPQVREDIVASLALRGPLRLLGGCDRPNICYTVNYWLQYNKDPIEQVCTALTELQGDTKTPVCAIIFTRRRKETEQRARQLRARGYGAQAYHGGMEKAHRSAVLNDWLGGVFGIVCGTVAFGMGIDKADVRLVAHLNLPKSLEGYYQESGRAGRDGLPARSLLFYNNEDRQRRERYLKKRSRRMRRGALEAFQAVVSFCTAERCRRRTLLSYFEERLPEGERDRGCCDFCRDPGRVHCKVGEVRRHTFEYSFRPQRSGNQGTAGGRGEGVVEEGSEGEGVSDSGGEGEAPAAAAARTAKRAREGALGGSQGGKRAGGSGGVRLRSSGRRRRTPHSAARRAPPTRMPWAAAAQAAAVVHGRAGAEQRQQRAPRGPPRGCTPRALPTRRCQQGVLQLGGAEADGGLVGAAEGGRFGKVGEGCAGALLTRSDGGRLKSSARTLKGGHLFGAR